MARGRKATCLEDDHRVSMRRLRKRGTLIGFRTPDSELYEARFFDGNRLQWHIHELTWEKYFEVIGFWTNCQGRPLFQ